MTCGKSSISACKTRTPRTTKRSPPSPSPSPPAAVNVSAFLFYFFSFCSQGKWQRPRQPPRPPPPNRTLLLWLCWDSNEYSPPSPCPWQAAKYSDYNNCGWRTSCQRWSRWGNFSFAFRFFVEGFLKSIGQLPSLVILGAKLMLSVATLMPNIRHDYPSDWQAERSQSRRVLELLPLDTRLARV